MPQNAFALRSKFLHRSIAASIAERSARFQAMCAEDVKGKVEDEFSRSLTAERTMVKFVGGLSGIALVLATVGLYGVMAYTTRQRTT